MPLPLDHDSVCVIGPRKSGKSTLIQAFIVNEFRVIAIDSSRGIKMAFKAPPFPSIETEKHVRRRGPMRLEIDATRYPRIALETASKYALISGPYERLLFCADELGDAVSFSRTANDLTYDESGQFSLLIRQGRHYGIRFLCGFQRSADIPRIVTANSQDWYVFQSWEPRDKQYVRGVLGDDLPAMAKHVCAHIREGSIVSFVKVQGGIPRRCTSSGEILPGKV